MEATRENVDKMKEELSIELMLIWDKYYDVLDERHREGLMEEMERKIAKMLPFYHGKVSPVKAFEDILFDAAEKYVEAAGR